MPLSQLFALKKKGSLAKVAIIPYEYLVKFGYKQDFENNFKKNKKSSFYKFCLPSRRTKYRNLIYFNFLNDGFSGKVYFFWKC
jgi:hypothetical protein